ncbi:IclR family transcriptional regulator [Prescottella soli]
MHAGESDVAPTAMLERLTLLLDAFNDTRSMTLAQIVDRTGLPRSSAHRMLGRLVDMQWLHRHGHEYQLGTRLIELGSIALHQNSLRSAAAPILQELHRSTGYLIHLGVLDGKDALYLDKIGGRLTTELPTRVGQRYPAHTSALGRVLLAHPPNDSGNTARLDPGLRRIREAGVAYELRRAGSIATIAAPIGRAGSVVAALSICGPSTHLEFDHRHAAPVRAAASAIMQTLNGHRGIAAPIPLGSRARATDTTNPNHYLRFA